MPLDGIMADGNDAGAPIAGADSSPRGAEAPFFGTGRAIRGDGCASGPRNTSSKSLRSNSGAAPVADACSALFATARG